MNRQFFVFVLGIFVAPLAMGQAVEKAQGYAAFRNLQGKNIFDPNRRPARSEVASRPAEAAPRSRSSALTLTGTMVTEERSLAFFGGTRADYSKVIPAGEPIADGKLISISSTQVEIERGGKRATLEVGRQLQIEGTPSDAVPEEATAPAGNPAAAAAPSPSDPTAPPAPATAPGTTSAPTNDKAEILRRMMERRQKETK